ncbi:MAG: carbohydrate-binding family 9-like protein [Polyangiaceae bacterium]
MRDTLALWAGLLAGAVAAAGCVGGGGKGLTSEEKERLKPFISATMPAGIAHPLDINFENKVHLIGYKFDPESAKPGQDVSLTYYWRCDEPLDDGWVLFTHTKDEASGKMGNLDFTGPIREMKGTRQVLGPDTWEKGKFYIDQQTYKVPTDVEGSEVSIMVGVWKGDARLRVISGPNDGDNSAIVGKVKTGVAPKAAADEHTLAEPPSLTVPKLAQGAKMTVDGKGDDAVWASAPSTGAFVDVGTGKPNTSFPVNATAKLLWDDKNLYVLVQVQEADFYTGFADAKSQPADFTAAGQPKLWTKDTIEMMVEPDAVGDNHDYYELQINPQNKVFKSQFDTLQQPSGGPNGPFGHEDWDPKLKSAVQILKGPDGKQTGYTVEAAIPWAGYVKAAHRPPTVGEVWRVNFYAMKNNGGVAWSPILGQGNFHKAARFAKVTWGGEGPVSAASSAGDGGLPPAMSAARGDGGGLHLRGMPPHVDPAGPKPKQP